MMAGLGKPFVGFPPCLRTTAAANPTVADPERTQASSVHVPVGG